MTIREVEVKEIQGWKAFAEKYKPKKNHLNGYDYENNFGFETYGAEVEYVKEQNNNYIWTRIQGDLCDLIVAGYAYVNRLEYYVTEIPWTDEDEYVLLSVEVECDCYNEEGYPNGEWGDENCAKCEGYGYMTEYVG